MTKFKLSLITGALLASSSAFAQVTAITNATVHTSTEQGILKDATVVIEGGKITAINPSNVNADITIDANDRILTPGFIGSMNQLGLVEVGAVAGSRDAGDDKAGVDFDTSSAFNPRSSLIPYARKGGVTQNVAVPYGGDSIFAGLGFVADLSGEFGSVTDKHTALVVHLGGKSKGSRALSYKQLVDKLEERQQALAKKDDKKDKDKKPSLEETVLTQVLNGQMPLVTHLTRASDILEIIKIKEQFGINLIIWGADDAQLVKSQLAKAKVPVIISAVSNLPTSFDSLHASLETAGALEKAGVKVILSIGGDGSHNVYQLRFDAGIAVSNGMSHEGAIKALTANVAESFGIEGGKIAKGERADLVLWSADPFEISTHVQKMWINGIEVTTESRHDKLRDRYTTESKLPRAYTK
ncbi:amidohydrolase family protein [Pseudoalteromonas sp. MMG013]|uniref:amidohydrolase family protein n=1 Tax=Pseudoalteromonas sp. MMG013 TaxID=2822687 RepID=UPI001B359C71|nr:amidohydrolase family protein [Pseudoalteromonas sp. MMG013]MBQ4864684.1 amidohydrolase family protein [Pseudoalteromonas sp. MMG013]